MLRHNNLFEGKIQKLAEMIPVVVVVTKNTRNAVGDELFIRMPLSANITKASLLFILIFLFLAACSDSDINIPNNQGIGFNKTLIAIYSPDNGSTLSANKPFILNYEVLRGIKTSYVKIQVDKTTPITVDKIKGKHHINALSEGIHTILISEYRSDGKPSGSQAIIKVKME
jgi:hypothetical protein